MLMLAFWWLSSQGSLFSQSVLLIGPGQLCLGDCGTYSLLSIDSFDIVDATWVVNGNTFSVSGPGPVTICADFPNGMDITVFGFTTLQDSFITETFVEVLNTVNPVIISTTAACPDSSATACDRVCANTSATYEVAGLPAGTSVDWQVLGADNFTTNGNQVTVEWGAPGQGEVTVSTGGFQTTDPLQVFCGQWTLNQLPNGQMGGDGFINIFGGVGPYQVYFEYPNGSSSLWTLPGSSTYPNGLNPGQYFVMVTDGSGVSQSCSFTIVASSQECWVSANPQQIVHPSAPGNNDGSVQMTAVGGVPPYTFMWSNGVTTQNLNGLSCGDYSVTVVDSDGCTSSLSINLNCNSGGSCPGSSSLCVEILEQPEANIGSLPPVVNGTIEVCQGQTVYFENQSLNATSYVWDFGDLNTSAQFEPDHTYHSPGTYTVSLIARNDCYCSDTTFVTVNVLAADVPDIFCTGTVCEGETVTYSTPATCGTYNWSITGGGTITDGGGPSDNFITIQWFTGPEGTVSLDVSGCTGSVCNLPNVIPIPILSDNVQIQGPSKVCEGSTEEYFIPDFDGTEITWTVLGSGIIKNGQGSERISIQWYGDANVGNPQRVVVTFDNCYLGCSGKDTLDVFIVPGFYVEGPIEVCESTTSTYLSRNTITGSLMMSNWQVFNAAGINIWTSAGATNMANIPFNFSPGSYTVRATTANASGFCNDTYDVFVKLVAAPPPVTAIDGATEICPGTPYSYEAQGLPNSDFAWTVTGGTPATFGGNPANVTWGVAPPYSVSVVQITTTGLACASQPVDLQVNPLPNFTLSGDAQVCREETGTYSVPFFENLDYQWTISPADAGTVVNGQGSESVNVLWHADGPATVNLSVCSFNKNFNVTVLPLPEPFAPDKEVCFGQTTVMTTSTPFTSYIWKNESGIQVSTLPNPALGGGFYEVEVTGANGCKGDTIFKIFEHPMPVVSISAPIYLGLCPNGPDATIYATTSEGGYDYAWFQNNTPVGTNASTFSTNVPGTYKVVVTDQHGCTGDSKLLLLQDCETAGGDCFGGYCGNGVCNGTGSPCVDGGNITFDINPTADCSTHQYQNTSVNFIPGSFFWEFSDPLSGAANTSTLDNPSHTFTKPGFYAILLLGAVVDANNPAGSCPDGQLSQDTILAVADFENTEVCPGAPMEFFDRSEHMDFTTLTAWNWDFGDPVSGANNFSNLQNPVHTFATPGSYNVKLTITAAGGCQSSITKNVTVVAPPSVDFTLPAISCENTALPFSANVSGDAASVLWDFGDPGSGASNTSELENTFHEFDVPSVYAVTVTATNVYGCTSSFSDNVTVDPNNLTGTIAYSQLSPICEGESITLTSPTGGTLWDWTTGAIVNNITTFESGVYDLTLTDANGCTYSPPPAPVDVFGEPNGIIKGVEYNEFGQPVAFFENNLTLCEGDDVTLIIQGSLNYSYTWSNGDTGDDIEFTEDKGNLLPVGTHVFTVTVTDNSTSCTSEEGPFTVTVNPRPDVQIASSPSGFLCENNAATLNVASPQAGLTYTWNTGETGTGISVIAGGTYFAQAVNQFGCRGRSNEIVVNNAPDIDLIPNGCHQRCAPDTVCLPFVANVSSYQWFFGGTPLAGPNGNLASPVFTESGDYYVEMTDIFGCTSISDVLSLTISPNFGTGDILGNVWFDANGNGVIDPSDTPVSGIPVFLSNGTVHLDTVLSGAAGDYLFNDLLANGYSLVLDTTSLPANWTATIDSTHLNLSGCSSELHFDWLLMLNCLPYTATVNLSACTGSFAMFDGVNIPAGDQEVFTYMGSLGCDSTLTVMVEALPVAVQFVDAVACANSFFEYEGQPLLPGTDTIFTEVNQWGCTDTTFVTVGEIPVNSSALSLPACGGAPVVYDGTQLFAGDVMDFTLTNSFGCDSVVTVTVTAALPDTVALALQVCEGETVEYSGQVLSAGDQIDLVFTNQAGCDSLVQVSVTGYSAVSYDLQANEICWNGTDGSVEAVNLSGGTGPYQFSLDGTAWQPGALFEGLSAGEYTVFLQDDHGCMFEKTIDIPTIPPIGVETQDETLTCGDSVRLSPVAISQLPLVWEWANGSASPELWASSPGVYTFKVTNDCETVERSVKVSMEPIALASLIYMPNSFSPNDDGINDCYQGYLSPRADLQYFNLKIFDRWGNMMFESNDPGECWDGRSEGKLMDPAVFVWFVEMKVLSCEGEVLDVFEEGGIHLIK